MEQFGISYEVIKVENYSEVFEILQENKADVGIVNRIFGVIESNNYDVRKTSLVFSPVALKFAFPMNAPKTVLWL